MIAMLAGTAAAAQAPSAPAAGVSERDVAWARPESGELMARLYRPEGVEGALPVVIDVHGGAWSAGDRNSGAVYDRGLAQAGFLVVAIDFRQGPAVQHPVAAADVAAAVRWAKLNAEAIGADPERIGLIGSSSGGHLALHAATKPSALAAGGAPILDAEGNALQGEADASVDYVVALWPVSDPHARYRYAQRAGLERIASGSLAYFPDEAAMLDASVPRIVTAGEAEVLPPVLVVQPGMDSNVPVEITFDLIRAYQSRDGKIEYSFFPGMPHAFGHRESPETSDMIALVADFVRRRTSEAEPQ
jgi:acetyl esterase/lipase